VTGGDEKPAASPFAAMQAKDTRNETRILWGEIAVIALLALLVASYWVVA
jgi:hypothetical protein